MLLLYDMFLMAWPIRTNLAIIGPITTICVFGLAILGILNLRSSRIGRPTFKNNFNHIRVLLNVEVK